MSMATHTTNNYLLTPAATGANDEDQQGSQIGVD